MYAIRFDWRDIDIVRAPGKLLAGKLTRTACPPQLVFKIQQENSINTCPAQLPRRG
jgi:hypothetical protein